MFDADLCKLGREITEMDRGFTRNIYEIQSKLLKAGYIGNYIGNYYRGYQGGYWELDPKP